MELRADPTQDSGEFPANSRRELHPLSCQSIQDDVRNEAGVLADDHGPILPYTHSDRFAGDQPAADQRVISREIRQRVNGLHDVILPAVGPVIADLRPAIADYLDIRPLS